jgi:prepilin-type N-terminal cleavage/methylation domain-containing protein
MKLMKTFLENKNVPRRRGFTLVELLVVISIISLLATFTIVGLKSVNRTRKLSTAKIELRELELAIENYKTKYGAYPPANQNPGALGYAPALLNQLYYELSGTTTTVIGGVSYFVTLDGGSQIKMADVTSAYGVGGFLNCTKGGGEDAAGAKNFLPGLKANRINSYVTNNGVRTTMLVTSVGGPDDNYQPLKAAGLNPFRYVCPGTNNPASYDLWVQLVIGNQTNLVCNWSKTVLRNSTLP